MGVLVVTLGQPLGRGQRPRQKNFSVHPSRFFSHGGLGGVTKPVTWPGPKDPAEKISQSTPPDFFRMGGWVASLGQSPGRGQRPRQKNFLVHPSGFFSQGGQGGVTRSVTWPGPKDPAEKFFSPPFQIFFARRSGVVSLGHHPHRNEMTQQKNVSYIKTSICNQPKQPQPNSNTTLIKPKHAPPDGTQILHPHRLGLAHRL